MVQPSAHFSIDPPVLSESQGLLARAGALATLSHEIRTPLNGVLGMTGLLEETELDDTQRAYLAALRASGEHLLTLVNDILDLAKLESGRVELEPAPVDLENLLQGVAELLAPRAQASDVEIAWSVANGAASVLADDGRLRQVLFNLAGNAVKMTAQYRTEHAGETGARGGVLIHGKTTALADGRVRLRLSVRDSGPGVSEAAKARIFEEFTQEAAGVRAGGAGLGLAIVRRIAEAMGARLGVDNLRHSEADYWGAEFWIEAEIPAAEACPSHPLPLKGKTLAVISESPVVREGALAQIRASGARAILTSGFAAVDPTYDAILLDPAPGAPPPRPPKSPPTFVLLAPEERGRIEAFREAGYSGYLIKPLRRASIVARLQASLGRAPFADEAERTEPAPRVSGEDERDAMARPGEGLRVLLVEDNAVNALLARALLVRAGAVVERAATGEEAVDAALTAPYDLILMDVRMPGMNGIEATRCLRAKGLKTPIVALTANAFEDDRRHCLEAGMNDFLTKPIAPLALNRLIAGLARDEAGAEKKRQRGLARAAT